MSTWDDLKSVADAVDAKLATATGQIQSLNSQLASKDAELSNTKSLLEQANATIEDLKEQIENLKSQKVIWGMAYASGQNPTDFESRVGKTLGIRRHFTPGEYNNLAVQAVKDDAAAGRKISQLSFKLNGSWADAANGNHDAWARSMASSLLAVKGNNRVQVVVHHEPENDTGTNTGSTTTGRDAWVNMQIRLGDIFRSAGLEYGIILMGWHSLPQAGGNTAVWLLERWLPKLSGHIDFVGIDPYSMVVDPKWVPTWLPYMKSQTKAINAEWGISEVALSEADFDKTPTWFSDLNKHLEDFDGKWCSYFNTTLNGTPQYAFTPGDPRETEFIKYL